MIMRKSYLYILSLLILLLVSFGTSSLTFAAVQVSVSNANFSSTTINAGKSYTASVYSSNSGSIMYTVNYSLEYYANGNWSPITGGSGSKQNGGFPTTLTTPSFTVPTNATQIRVTWTIPSNSNITITGGPATKTASVTSIKPEVSVSNANFNSTTINAGKSYTASVYSSNSGSIMYNINYSLEYYANGSWSPITGGSGSKQNGGFPTTLTTPSFTVPTDATKIKVTWTIPSNSNITITDGTATKTLSVNLSKTLSSISVSPDSKTITGLNTSGGSLKVTAKYSDGSTTDVTHNTEYTSTNNNIAFVKDGGVLYSGGSIGTATITASYTQNNINKTDKCTVTVTQSNQKATVSFVGSPTITLKPRVSGSSSGNWFSEVTVKSSQDVTFKLQGKIDLYLMDGSYYGDAFDHTYTNSTSECEKIYNNDGTYSYLFNPNGGPLPLALKTAKATWTLVPNDNITISGSSSVSVTATVASPQKPTVTLVGAVYKDSAKSTITEMEVGKAYTSVATIKNPDLAKGQVSYEVFYSTDGAQYVSKYKGTRNINGNGEQNHETDPFTIESGCKSVKVTWTVVPNAVNNIVNSPYTKDINVKQTEVLTVTLVSSDFVDKATRNNVASLEVGKEYYPVVKIRNMNSQLAKLSFKMYYHNGTSEVLMPTDTWVDAISSDTWMAPPFKVESTYKNYVKVVWTMEPVAGAAINISGSPLTKQVPIKEVLLPTISLTGAGYMDSQTGAIVTTPLDPAKTYKAYVDTSNTSANQFNISYTLKYSTDGTNFIASNVAGRVTLPANGGRVYCPTVINIPAGSKKIKMEWTLPVTPEATITNDTQVPEIAVIEKSTVSLTGAGFDPAVPLVGNTTKAYVDTTNSSTEGYKINCKIMYSTDGTNYTGTVGSYTLNQTGMPTQKLETRTFTVNDNYKKIKVTFTIPETEPVDVTGDRTKEVIVDVMLPAVGITGAGFAPSVPVVGDKAKAYVETTNSNTHRYKISYKVMYSTDGINFTGTMASSTIYQTGKTTERLETKTFTVKKNHKKIKVIFTIPETEPVDVTGDRTKEVIVDLAQSSYEFSDVPSSHWAYTAITELAKRGVISGYPDGTFKPDKEVTRAEFAKIMTLALNLPVNRTAQQTFVDVDRKNWAFQYVEAAKSYLTGYRTSSGLKFKGNENAVREDIAVALVKAQGYENDAVDEAELNSLFTDSDQISSNLKRYILIAKKRGLIDGYPDRTFKPQATLTRAEAAKLLWQVLSQEDQKIVIP